MVQEESKKEFTGIWMPAEILEDENLKPIDKLLYAEIASFPNGCWKKSEELQQICGVKEDAFRESAKRLRDAGYIKEHRKFGRIHRYSTLGFTHQREKPRVEHGEKPRDEQREKPRVHIDNTKDNTIDNTTLTKVNGVTTYGNVDINTVMDDLYGGIGLKPIKVKQQRIAASNLIKRHGLENTRKLIKIALQLQETDTYASRITSMQDLWNKQNNILVSIKKNNSNQLNNQIRSV